ncbi:N-acetylmuramoyl-L-alanine amidase [Aridibaculum aurantiacum]|uniref:N-acetylmuramoyl-L-alanine amidase n=1 Tax=Aridibaculum aurantiacum TaxID=2810307 RepID=UPI001A97B1BD|nr:N-acetylmuramoyl-L-alanine amidase [Aridibaculum aurantiacum]
MIAITQNFITNRNRPFKNLTQLKGIVIHYTANYGKGANADAHRKYIGRDLTSKNGSPLKVSAHYFVDDSKIIHCVPDKEVAYHCGSGPGLPYTELANEIRQGKSANDFLIGIEMCVNVDCNWSKTYQNTVDLTAHLLLKYNLTVEKVFRHFDITHKVCPKMMVEDPALWIQFKNDVYAKTTGMSAITVHSGKVIAKALNVRKTPVVEQNNLVKTIPHNHVVTIYESKNGWLRIGPNQWVKEDYVSITN